MSESPSSVLRQAAARVRETSAACEPEEASLREAPWRTVEFAVDLSPRAVVQSAPSPDERARFRRYVAEAETPELAAWIALMHTGLGEPLAAMFDAWARMAELDPDLLNRVGGRETLAAARVLLGTKETTA